MNLLFEPVSQSGDFVVLTRPVSIWASFSVSHQWNWYKDSPAISIFGPKSLVLIQKDHSL